MDTIPTEDPMENPPHPPLAGLDPANLLKQGVAADTFIEQDASPFHPPLIEELAPLFPQFEILGLIGKGGMGAVYKVRQKDLDRIVALKILPPVIGETPGFSERFTREAKALAKLNHPGIVTIHEFGQRDGLYFILMEFVDGVNLAQLMHTGRISPREALAIVPQICDALQFAHDQGIVHRDIKPENILLDRLGRVKVADFGIAKVVASVGDPLNPADEQRHSPPDATLAGKIIGTPQYMAPEQIDHPSQVDHRADIYALGVVFYQMLTGELPGKQLQPPSRMVHIDVRLDEIVLQALEKNPALRFQQASVMKTRVDQVAAPPAIPQPPKRGVIRRWWWIFLVMLPLGLLVGLGAGAAWFYTIPKMYEATSTIEIVAPPGSGMTPNLFGTQFEVIKSQESLATVAQELELSQKWRLSPDSVVRTLRGIINTENIRGTDLVSIRVRDSNKSEAAAIANAVALTYQHRFPERSIIHEMAVESAAPISPKLRLTLVLFCLAGLLLSLPVALLLMKLLQRKFPEAKQQPPAVKPSSNGKWIALGCGVICLIGALPVVVVGMLFWRRNAAVKSVMQHAQIARAESQAMALKNKPKAIAKSVALEKTAPAEAGQSAEPVMINLKPEGMFLNGEKLTYEILQNKLGSLKQQNPDLYVIVKADVQVGYAKVTEMLDRLAKLGITKVSFATVGKEQNADSTPSSESEPAQLRGLDWQDQVEACNGEAWLPSGEVDRSNDWMPPITPVDISQTRAAKAKPRFLCLWFSHPLFDRQSVTEVSLLDADGKKPLEVPSGEKAIGVIPASPENAGTGWITATLCAGKRAQIPAKATVALRYSGGDWQFWKEIAPNFRGPQSLGEGVMLSEPGQDADGDAFIQTTRGSSADEQFDFVAITRDGRRLERIDHGESSAGKVVTERYSFPVPLAEVKAFECRKRPIHQMSWPVVLMETHDTSGKMKIDFDRAGDSMQNILYNFVRLHDVRICFENLDFDAKRDAITLGRRISMLEEKQRGGKLTNREAELLKDARHLRKDEKLGDETLVDVGERYEGKIVAGSVEDFLNQLTKDTPYDWTYTDGHGSWVVLPRAGTRLNYPVTLDTAELSVEEAVAKVIEQRPAGSEIGVGQVNSRPVALGTDSDPWLHVKCKPAKIQGIPAWRALCVIGEGARPDSVWELAGYKEHRMLSLAPGPGMETGIISEVQAWLLALDRGEYAKSWETAAESFHTAFKKEAWLENLEQIRKPLGAAISRKVSETRRMMTLPGMPDGSYFEVKFESSFATKGKAVETVTFSLEKDGTWKASGYFIR